MMAGLLDLIATQKRPIAPIPSIPAAFQPGDEPNIPTLPYVDDSSTMPPEIAQAAGVTAPASLKPQTGFFAGPTPAPGQPYEAPSTGDKISRVLAAISAIGDKLGAQYGTPSQKEFYLGNQRNAREAAMLNLQTSESQQRLALEQRRQQQEEMKNAASILGETTAGGEVPFRGSNVHIPGTTERAKNEIDLYKAQETAKSDIDAETKTKQAQKFVEKVYGITPDNPAYQASVLNVLGKEPILDAGKYLNDPSLNGVMLPAGKLISDKLGNQRIAIQWSKLGQALAKGTADETRRADLGENMLENLNQIEDIAKRRPELFGPAHLFDEQGGFNPGFGGRGTNVKSFFGTNDPDIGALKTAQEQLGMAMVGAHSMRNAQHVQTAYNAILNNLNNGGPALAGAFKAARESVKTFLADEGRDETTGAKPKVNTNANSRRSSRRSNPNQNSNSVPTAPPGAVVHYEGQAQ